MSRYQHWIGVGTWLVAHGLILHSLGLTVQRFIT